MNFTLTQEFPLSIIHVVTHGEDSGDPHGHTWFLGIELRHHELKDGYLVDPDLIQAEFGSALYEAFDEAHLNYACSESETEPMPSVTPELFAQFIYTEIKQTYVWGKYLTRVYIRQGDDFTVGYSD